LPELPEVEIYRRYFEAHALGRRVSKVAVRDPRIVGETTAAALRSALVGQEFDDLLRHGKHLFARAGRLWLHLHFGMTGDLVWYEDDADEPRFSRVSIDFEGGGHLSYEDMRLFGVVDLTASPQAYIEAHGLGPDVLDPRLRLRDFRRRLARRRGAIKAVLISQELVAGLGNLYVDEALFQTGIDPRRPAERLSADEVRALFLTMRRILVTVLERKIAGRGYAPRYLVNYREEGDRCPRCGGEIRRTVVAGRTTYFCGRHQK
jgi:formamidopyrimidine-DNA glycosylase